MTTAGRVSLWTCGHYIPLSIQILSLKPYMEPNNFLALFHQMCLSPLVTHLTRLARLTRLAARGGDRKYRNKFKSVFIDNRIEKLAKTLHMKRSR